MKKTATILLALLGLVLITVLTLSLLIRFYLTDDRIKALVIPPVENALARKVVIGAIKVSLLHGITVEDFAVKELDGKDDFARARAFVLRYDLLPLLQKKLVVSEIVLQEPSIHIHRDTAGKFNFETLAFLREKNEEKKAVPAAGATALPIALTVEQIRVERAAIAVSDDKNELPRLQVNADLKLAVDLHDLAAVTYKGELGFQADAVHGSLQPHLVGTSSFDDKNLVLQGDLSLDKEKMHLSGEIKNYAAAPAIRLDLSSEALDLDHLLALLAGLPRAAQEAEKKLPPADVPQKPAGLGAEGKITVGKALYNTLSLENIALAYALRNGIFTISQLRAEAVGGTVAARELRLDLNTPTLIYQGEVKAEGIELSALRKALKPEAEEMFGGVLASEIRFRGAGTEWEEIKRKLAADGTYSISKGWFRNNEISRTVAALVGLPELQDLSFERAAGNIRVRDGNIGLDSRADSQDLKIATQGTIGLDGALALPVTLTLSPVLSEKLRQRIAIAKYLANEEGETVLRLNLTGTVEKPRPSLDEKALLSRTEEVIKKKLLEKLGTPPAEQEGSGGEAKPRQESPGDLIKGIFGL
ncbi:AsmA family protein [Thiovibrio sp. JS02]